MVRSRSRAAERLPPAPDENSRPGYFHHRGSTVRVRQRASSFLLLSRCFRGVGWRRPRGSASTRRPPASTVDVVPRSTRRAGGSRARVRPGGGGRNAGRSWSAGAHVAGEIEGRDTGTEPKVATCAGDRRPCAGFDPSSELRGLPLAVTEVVQVEVTRAYFGPVLRPPRAGAR